MKILLLKATALIAVILCAVNLNAGAIEKKTSAKLKYEKHQHNHHEAEHKHNRQTIKPRPPVSIDYRLKGEPALGQPLEIDLIVSSTLENPVPIAVNYRALDKEAMRFTSHARDNQSFKLSANISTNNKRTIVVVPQKEGRNYFTVTTQIETDNGPMSISRSIAIQIGDEPYNKKINGQLVLDSKGKAVISMSASER